MSAIAGDLKLTASPLPEEGWTHCTEGNRKHRNGEAHQLFLRICPAYPTFSVTTGSPGTITVDQHGLESNERVFFDTGNQIPAGLTADTEYFVILLSLNEFQLATSVNGSAIPITSTAKIGCKLRRCTHGIDDPDYFNIPQIVSPAEGFRYLIKL